MNHWRRRGVWGLGGLWVAVAGCAGVDGRADQTAEAIALAPAPLVEPGVGNSNPVGVIGPVSFAGGPSGWFASWSVINWGLPGFSYYHAMGARIGASGEITDRPAFTFNSNPYVTGFAIATAALGDRWIASFTNQPSALVNGGLATVPLVGAPRPTPVAGSSCLTFSCDAAGCLCEGDMTFRRLDATGAAAGPALNLGPVSGGSAIAASATQWLVVFPSTNPDTGTPDLRLNRVRRDGTVRDGAGVAFTTVAAGRTQPAVASDGAAFLVVFVATSGSGSRTPGVYAQRLEAESGVVAGPPVQLEAGTNFGSPSVAWDGARYWVAWQRQTCSDPGCTAPGGYARVAQDGTLLDTAPRPIGVNTRRPKVAVSAGRVAMLWQEREQGAAVFQRFGADGAAVSSADLLTYQAERTSIPALASDGSRFALTCQSDVADVTARAWLFGANGAIESPAGVSFVGAAPQSLFWDGARYRGIASSSNQPSYPAAQVTLSADGRTFARTALPTIGYVTSSGGVALVGGVTFVRTYGGVQRLDASGALLDPLPIAFGGYNTVLATDGTVLLGVWSVDASVRAARMSRDGDVLDATAWDWSYTPPGGVAEPFSPSGAAFGGGVWTVVGTGNAGALRLRQASTSGTFLRSVSLPGNAADNSAPVVAWNGQEFVVAALAGSPVGRQVLQGSMRAWSVRPDGAVSPPEGIPLDPTAAQPGPIANSNVAIATLANGTTAVAWGRSDTQRATWRCVARVLQPGMGVDAGTPMADAGTPVADAGTPVADAGTPMADAGTPMADAGMPMADAGTPRVDAGTPVADAGTPVADAGMPMADAGTPMADAGMPVADAGTPMADAGTPVADAGTPVADAGTPMADAGTPVADAGSPMADAGSPMADAGTPVADAGSPMADAGMPVADAGTPMADASTADAGAPTAAPADDGGCDVGGAAGSRSPLAASLPLLALALAARTGRRKVRRDGPGRGTPRRATVSPS